MREEFKPESYDWYPAILDHVRPEINALMATLENGETVICFQHSITFSPQHHYLCQPPGTRMSVRIEPNSKFLSGKSSIPWYAIEAQLEADENAEPVNETGVIEHWDENHGCARRDCGCTIFIKTNGNFFPLNVGDRVDFQVEFSDFKGNFIGVIDVAEEEF
jgi:hypothetical protein